MNELEVQHMLGGLCRAAEAFDGKTFASYFAEDGVYHDDFYGSFVGRERLADLINAWFFKHARDMRWDMIDPVYQAGRLNVRYVFSYNSKLPEAQGARRMFEGVSMMSLRDKKNHRVSRNHRLRNRVCRHELRPGTDLQDLLPQRGRDEGKTGGASTFAK
jgi:hypothetical protein